VAVATDPYTPPDPTWNTPVDVSWQNDPTWNTPVDTSANAYTPPDTTWSWDQTSTFDTSSY
jgi:hypothetical protein